MEKEHVGATEKKKPKRETQLNLIQQVVAIADTLAQTQLHPAQQQQQQKKLKRKITSPEGEGNEPNKKNLQVLTVFEAEVSNQKAVHLGMNPHQR